MGLTCKQYNTLSGWWEGLMCNVLRVGVADVQWKVGRIDVQCSEGGCG